MNSNSMSSLSFLTRSNWKVRGATSTALTNSSSTSLPAVDNSVWQEDHSLPSGYMKTHIPTGILAAMQNQNHGHFLQPLVLSGTKKLRYSGNPREAVNETTPCAQGQSSGVPWACACLRLCLFHSITSYRKHSLWQQIMSVHRRR